MAYLDLLMAFSLLAIWYLIRLPRPSKEAYQDYLRSRGWQWTKALRKRGRCAKCKTTNGLELHHKSYFWHNLLYPVRDYVPNLLDPMVTLCSYHHGKEHGR